MNIFNLRNILILYCILTTIAVVSLFRMYQNGRNEIKRYENNQEELMSDIEYYKTKDGKNVATVTQLELTVDEFKKLCNDQKDLIKSLNIKVNRLENLSTTVTESIVEIKTEIHDTIYLGNHMRSFEWSDEWNHISGIIEDDSVQCTYNGIDTLNIVAHRVPKKWWFFKWGTKRIDVELTNSNPSNNIIYNQTIKLK